MRQNLKNARCASGLKLREVAQALGISLRHYQRIEAGTRTGKYETWQKLSDLFGKPQDVLRINTEKCSGKRNE